MKNSRILLITLSLFLLSALAVYAAGGNGGAASTEERVDIKLNQWSTYLDDVDGIANDRIKKYLEDKLNINLTITDHAPDNWQAKLVAAMAAGTAADIQGASLRSGRPAMADWQKWVKDEAIVDIGAMADAEPDRYPILKMIKEDTVWKLYNDFYNGDAEATYAIYGARFRQRAWNSIVYNGYLLKELGLAVPETYDEFIAALRTAKREKGIAGYGWTSYKGTSWGAIGAHFFEPMGARIEGIVQDSSGNWYDAAVDPKNKAIWKQVQGYWEEGLFYPQFLTSELYDFVDDMVASKLLCGDVKAPSPGQYRMTLVDFFQKKYPDATEADLPQGEYPLRGPGGTGPDPLPVVSFQNVWQHFIPYSSKHPDRALDVIEYMLTDEGQLLHIWGVKGIHYTKDDFSDWNPAEFRKDDVYNKDPNRYEWWPFMFLANGAQAFSSFEKYGNWIDAVLNVQTYNFYAPFKPGGREPMTTSPYADRIYAQHMESVKEAEPYMAFVSLTEDENVISKKLIDVRLKWFTQFFVGQKDPDTEWDNFVKEYKAAGADQIVKAYTAHVAAAKAKWDMVSGN